MKPRVIPHRRIPTKGPAGAVNGWLLPIFNVHDRQIELAQHPQQVYLTVAGPREIKGPHLHHQRWGLFTCIKGNGKIVVREPEGYREYLTGEDHDFATVQVPAGYPAALQNLGDTEAYFLNMPAPAWHPDNLDEHPVSFDDYVYTWPDRSPVSRHGH